MKSFIVKTIFLLFFTVHFFADASSDGGSGNIEGRVINDSTSLPISGATINVMKGTHVIDSGTTDSNGDYEITNLKPGNYVLSCSASGFRTQVVRVKVVRNKTKTVDFSLVPIGGTISGTVTEEANPGTPIVGATVKIFKYLTFITSTTTDNSGNYSVENLAGGHYIVVVEATGFQTQKKGAFVTAGSTVTVDFALLESLGNISGTVKDAVLRGSIEGALIQLFEGKHIIATALTDNNGDYSFLNLNPAHYQLVADADGYRVKKMGANVLPNETAVVDFNLKPFPGTLTGTVTDAITTDPIASTTVQVYDGPILVGHSLTDFEGNYEVPNLPPGHYIAVAQAENFQTAHTGVTIIQDQTTVVDFALQPDPGTVSGLVSDSATTDPVVGATITIYQGSVVVATALTDPNGEYSIPHLAPGQYIAVASADGYQTQTTGVTVSSNVVTTVNFDLNPDPGSISGIITNVDSKDPIQGATVLVFRNFIPVAVVVSDSNGFYSIPNLAPANYFVIAFARDFRANFTGAVVNSNQDTTANISLKPYPGAISGTVLDMSTSLPIVGATIEVFDDIVKVGSAVTNKDGYYFISYLSPQTYTVVASKSDYETAHATANILSNKTTTVNFSLEPNDGTITGNITDGVTTNPISGAAIAIFLGDMLVTSTLTDSNGDYTVPDLAPNEYNVVGSATGYETEVSTALVTAGNTTIVNFSLDPNPGAIAGVVVDVATMDLISGVKIQVFENGVPIGHGVTDNKGGYFIGDLAPGNYSVEASIRGYVTDNMEATVVADLTSFVDFSLVPIPSPPLVVTGSIVNNEFITRRDHIHRVQWLASISPNIVEYRVYRNGVLVSQVLSSATLEYLDHRRSRRSVDMYGVTAVNSSGEESEPGTVSLK